MTQDGHCKEDIRSRIAGARNASLNRKELLTKSFSLDLKKRIVKTVIWNALLYGAESWALRRDDIRRLESCKMWLCRRILDISWSDKISNDEVLRRVEEEKSIISTIGKRQRAWLGHTLRQGDLLPIVIEGRVEGRRPPGRPRTGILDGIKNDNSYQSIMRRAFERNYKAEPSYGQTYWKKQFLTGSSFNVYLYSGKISISIF